MKTNFLSIFRPLLYVFIGLSLVFACQQINPLDEVELTVSSAVTKSPVLIHFANANSTSTNQPSDFAVSISGKNASSVQMDGESTDFQASHGLLPLYLKGESAPSPSNPVTFNVYAEIPGFAPVSQTITVTSDSAKTIDITTVEYANPADGTSVATTQGVLKNGVSDGQTIATPVRASMAEVTTVSIPAGTQVLDASGNAINANQLTANVVNYSAISPTSYGAFPGGFNPTNVVDEKGQPISNSEGINFVSAGLVSIKMNAGGTAIKKFSKPIDVSMEVNTNTTNFETGENVKEGDTVPLWSLNEETGAWKKEGIVTLTKNSNGKLVANFQTTHLSCFNLDWYWFYGLGTCNRPLTVTLHIGAGKSGYFDVTLATPNNQYLAALHGAYLTDGMKVTFPNVANIPKAKIVITEFNLWLNPRLPILAQTGLFNPCTQGSIDISFGAPVVPEIININVDISGKCANKNAKILPTGWFYIYDQTNAMAGKYGWTFIYLVNGRIIYSYGSKVTLVNGAINLQMWNGHQYILYSWIGNKWYSSGVFTMSKNNFTLPAGTGITGSAVYVAATNSLNITGTFTPNCK